MIVSAFPSDSSFLNLSDCQYFLHASEFVGLLRELNEVGCIFAAVRQDSYELRVR